MDTESLDKLMEAAELIGSKDLEAYFKAYWGGKVEDREDEYVLEEEGSLISVQVPLPALLIPLTLLLQAHAFPHLIPRQE